MSGRSLNRNKKLSFIDDGVQTEKLDASKRKTYFPCPVLSTEEKFKVLSKYIYSDFDFIFKIAYVSGITFTTESEGIDIPHFRNNTVKKYYDIAINLFYFLSLVLLIALGHNFADSRAMMLTFSALYISCFVIRCGLIAKTSEVPQLMTTLSQIYGEVSSSIYVSLKTKIYLQCLTMILLIFLILGVTTAEIFNDTDIRNITFLTIFGHNLTVTEDITIMYVLLAAQTFNLLISTLTISVSLLVCWNIHIILYRLIRSYDHILVGDMKSKAAKETLTKDFVTFRRIMNSISTTDNALSFITFFIYASCISCFFNALSYALVIDTDSIGNNPYLAADIILFFLLCGLTFAIFTYSAALVSSAGDNLKSRIISISEVILKKNLPTETLLCFIILIENIKCSSTGMTGWGIFTITKGFVLSTIGAMITYGVVIFQFG